MESYTQTLEVYKQLTIISVSDIHLGHSTTPTTRIIENLQREFNSNTLKDVHILFIAGDIFDRMLNLPDDRVSEIQNWIYKLLRDCKITNTTLRVLHGTGSHDFGQGKMFIHVNDISGINCDVKYIDKLDIEYIDRFNTNVLYIPDEWRGDSKQTQNEVIDLMHSKRLTTVDISVMHGFFGFQTPDRIQAHDENFYSNITKHFVTIGHVHLYSEYKNIIAQGSFDRIRQGEEGKKGYIKVFLNLEDPSHNKRVFCENKYATLYKTINITKLDSKLAVENVFDKVIYLWRINFPDIKIRPLLFIRILYDNGQNVKDVFLSYSQNYKEITWTFNKEETKETQGEYLQKDINFEPIVINHNTIIDVYNNTLGSNANQIGEEERFKVLEIIRNTKNRINST